MAVQFDSVNDYARITSGPSLLDGSGCTIACFGYISVDRNDFTTFFALEDTGGASRILVQTDGDGVTLNVYTASGGGSIPGTKPVLTVGTWYFIALSLPVTGTSGTLYVGELNQALTAYGTNFERFTPVNFSLASNVTFNTEWLNGQLAYVRVWDAPLSENELTSESRSWEVVRQSNLWASYDFVGVSTGTRFDDASANGRDLTPNGTGAWTNPTNPAVSSLIRAELLPYSRLAPVEGTPIPACDSLISTLGEVLPVSLYNTEGVALNTVDGMNATVLVPVEALDVIGDS